MEHLGIVGMIVLGYGVLSLVCMAVMLTLAHRAARALPHVNRGGADGTMVWQGMARPLHPGEGGET